jgi:hypothetical protein
MPARTVDELIMRFMILASVVTITDFGPKLRM